MMWGCQGLSLRCCRDKNREIRTSLLFCLLERIFFVLLFVGKARLVGIVPLSSFLFFDLGDMIAKFCFLQKIL